MNHALMLGGTALVRWGHGSTNVTGWGFVGVYGLLVLTRPFKVEFKGKGKA